MFALIVIDPLEPIVKGQTLGKFRPRCGNRSQEDIFLTLGDIGTGICDNSIEVREDAHQKHHREDRKKRVPAAHLNLSMHIVWLFRDVSRMNRPRSMPRIQYSPNVRTILYCQES
jgi:hypothetical protein